MVFWLFSRSSKLVIFMSGKQKKAEIGMGISAFSCFYLHPKVCVWEDLPLPSIQEAEAQAALPLQPGLRLMTGSREQFVVSKVSLQLFTTLWWSLTWRGDGACYADGSWCCEKLCRTRISCASKGIAGLLAASALCCACLTTTATSAQLKAPLGLAVQVRAVFPPVGNREKGTGISGVQVISS